MGKLNEADSDELEFEHPALFFWGAGVGGAHSFLS